MQQANSALEKILTDITPDTTLITPNRRLASHLHKRYQNLQRELQNEFWLTPDILPVFNWQERLWNDFTSSEFKDTPLLLNSIQEQFLWEKIIAHSKESEQFLQISETADLARSAFSLLKQWQVNINQSIFASSEDYVAFKQWAHDFTKCCREKNRIDSSSLPDLLITHIKNKTIKPPKHLFLIGFNELAPQFKSLLLACEEQGCIVLKSDPQRQAFCEEESRVIRRKAIDDENELLLMANFAKSIWEKNSVSRPGKPESNDHISMACVIPALEQKRDRVLQIFTQVFSADGQLTLDREKCPFNISAGQSLAHYPIIRTALLLLQLQKKIMPLETFSYLLASPFVGDAERERIKRAKFDCVLRKSNITTIDLSPSETLSSHMNLLTNNCSSLAKRLKHAFALLEEKNQRLTYSEWAEVFNELLRILGWPGERSLNSEEYQTVEQWLQLFSQYVSLDSLSSEVNFQQALQILQKTAIKTIFQPKTPAAPIQILGILEASGLPFDYLWVGGLDDLAWPPQPHPNPFIPKILQRELNMPHATAEREYEYCKQLIQQFKENAKQVIFSYAEKRDELCLHPSSLISDLPEITFSQSGVSDLISVPSPRERIYATKNLEIFIDEQAPPVNLQEKIRGGVNVIKQQALCPFRAFAQWRLHAEELENPLPGLRAKDRGMIVHKALEIVWNHLQDHTTLSNMLDHELEALLESCVKEALQFYISQNTHFFNLEKQRLKKLLLNWLKLEKERPPFKVLNNEKSAQIQLNQLTLSIKIDRIDELADGKKLIIDYKTSKNNEINKWFGERIDEPQLPLYLFIDPENTVGISFAQFVPGENKFKGISHYSLDIPGIKSVEEVKSISSKSWIEQVQEWKDVLTKLSDNFYQGNAQVDPKDLNATCQWCALQALCRINEEANIFE